MDYFRNSFAKNIDSIVTLYDVRYAYNKNKEILHADDGLSEKFIERLNYLRATTTCTLMMACLDEIIELLGEPIIREVVPIDVQVEVEEKAPEPKPRKNLFKEDANNLEEFFKKKSSSENLLEAVTLEIIKRSLEDNDFNLTKTAKNLGISPRTLRSKILDIRKREECDEQSNFR
jgi:DNA-binding NtrC family response regulator